VRSNGSGPVFVDRTGRRRRLVTAFGVGVGLVLAAVMALIVAGVFGASPVPLPGLPRGGQGAQEGTVVPAEMAPAGGPSEPTTSRPARVPSATPVPGSGAPAASVSSSSAPSRPPRGNKPSEHPGNPHPGRSK
jgi:hypothetical protein